MLTYLCKKTSLGESLAESHAYNPIGDSGETLGEREKSRQESHQESSRESRREARLDFCLFCLLTKVVKS